MIRLRRFVAPLLFAIAAAGLIGCQRGKPAAPPMPSPKVTVTHPVMYPVQGYHEYNGYLDPIETVQIRARVGGFLATITFKEGDEVAAGKVLYTIDDREYVAGVKKAEADNLKAAAEVKRSLADESRSRSARATGSTSEDEYQQKVANRETAEAVLKQTEASLETAKLTLSYTKIPSPIDGRISRTLVTRGNLVGQGDATLLTTVVSLDSLYVYFDVPERDLVEYQRALRQRTLPSPTSQELLVEVGVATEEGYPHLGKIDFRENRVDTGTGTVRLRGLVPNPAFAPAPLHGIEAPLAAVVGTAAVAGSPVTRLLYPGLYARVRVPSGGPRLRPVIPEDVLLTGQEGRYVYVLTPENKVARRTVAVGPQVYRAPPPGDPRPVAWTLQNPNPASKMPVKSVVAVEKGLDPTDVVIVDGLQKTRPGGEVVPEMWEFRGPP